MVKIIADTTSCLSLEQARNRGIYYIPQIIVIGEESYRDDTEMGAREFLQRQKNSPVLPKTAAPPPALYNPIYQEILDRGHSALVIAPSSQVSGTFRSAQVAAQDFPEAHIQIIDTQVIAGGLGAIVLKAQDWADEGLTVDEISQRVKALCLRHRVYFVVDTLEYLYKGGRIGAASALVGSLLLTKPILTIKDGHTESYERQHTHRKAIARLKEIILQQCAPGPQGMLSLMHGDVESEALTVANEVAPKLGVDRSSIPVYDLTPAILTHSGPGVIAASFFVN